MTSDFTIGDATRYKAIIEGNTIKIKDLELFLKDWRTMKKKAENWDRLVGDPAGYIEKCRLNIKKLEAIKKWYNYIYNSPDVPLDDFRFPEDSMVRLKKILEDQSSGGKLNEN